MHAVVPGRFQNKGILFAASSEWSYRAKNYQEEHLILFWALPLHFWFQRKSWDPVLGVPNYAPTLTQHHSSGVVWHTQLSYVLPSLSLYLLKRAGYETPLTGCLPQQSTNSVMSKLSDTHF